MFVRDFAKWKKWKPALAAAALLLLLSVRTAQAQTLTWDPSGSSGYSNSSGAWDNTTTNWWSGSSTGSWTSGGTAQFGGGSGSTAYTVTLGTAGITADGVIFQSQAYTL